VIFLRLINLRRLVSNAADILEVSVHSLPLIVGYHTAGCYFWPSNIKCRQQATAVESDTGNGSTRMTSRTESGVEPAALL